MLASLDGMPRLASPSLVVDPPTSCLFKQSSAPMGELWQPEVAVRRRLRMPSGRADVERAVGTTREVVAVGSGEPKRIEEERKEMKIK